MSLEIETQKRKLEANIEGVTKVADTTTKRAAGDGNVPMEVNTVQKMKNEDFNMEFLRLYYDRLFPFLQMFRWLSYGNNPQSSSTAVQKDFFLRREFTFVLQGDIFCRYLCFRDMEEFRAQVIARQPIRMEIGAVFSHPPKNHHTVIKDAYKPVEREFVLDIDMDDYDDVRTCCSGAKICVKCWTFMRAAISTLNHALREDFGFEHFFFVYSGRRGVHCWVCDQKARQLSNEQRSAVADYLTMHTPGANKVKAEIKTYGCEHIHPAVVAAHNKCEYFFKEDPNGVLKGQDILKHGPHLANILEQTLTLPEREEVSKFVNSTPTATSSDIWAKIEKVSEDRNRQAANGSFKQKMEAKMFLKDVVIQYTYPRLDINVSKQMNHLLKAPFVVHPKTGRVCVPIDPATVETFDPAKVPTIGRLVEELAETGDMRDTSLKPYTSYFEKFLQGMEKENRELRPADLGF